MHLHSKANPYAAEHLLVLPVPFRELGGRLHIELQAHLGLERWLENFSSLTLAAPTIPDSQAEKRSDIVWVPAEDLSGRVRFVKLPWAYAPWEAIGTLHAARRVLRDCIAGATYLQFAIGGFWGDWAGVAAELAITLHRRFAVHMDRVEHEVIERTLEHLRPPRKWKARLDALAMKHWHRRLIRRADLALCHGADCYQAYQSWARRPELVHNIHDLLVEGSAISEAFVVRKGRDYDGCLRICYAGRAESMKAPLDWLQALVVARDQGARFHATWMGGGSLYGAMQQEISQRGLERHVSLPGFVSDRARVMQQISENHIMLFTHVTPESPRCLVEALRCGTAILGYESAYPRDLINGRGGGLLTPMGQPEALGLEIARLSRDRQRVADLMCRAYRDGRRFGSSEVFRHRSALIRKHLGGDG